MARATTTLETSQYAEQCSFTTVAWSAAREGPGRTHPVTFGEHLFSGLGQLNETTTNGLKTAIAQIFKVCLGGVLASELHCGTFFGHRPTSSGISLSACRACYRRPLKGGKNKRSGESEACREY